ncbi:glyceraldehyde-3-phosphate dehydrogenase, type I [Desulfovibrio sp. X2]|uniref:type I glyceraldehyde-3-phosphate dehydrogenase n=1 Tax=Desulfovibrio sp. X2 TaxID=941449 RepID=UPI000358D8BD|nr:type I glyceraldehyde-3-phosphate dehydrogenase [Desulfovibrio sp. X2]EPR43880.1 glyceraldehyde-3-phosphate dehydrogenase, type I [Desulfovibrio sp. X2]
MAIKIGLNGWGRIGRYLARLMAEDGFPLDLAVINARASNSDLAHLFKYDSVHRTFKGEVSTWENGIVIAGKKIVVTRSAPCEWEWAQNGCDLVIESTGKFTDRASCEKHIERGAKKVIISAPGKNPDVTVVMGVNHKDYDPKSHRIISSASCTTNCLAPVAKVLHDTFGIRHGHMTTVHSYTMSQRILDGSHKDLRRGRAACMSMLPTTTGAAKVVGVVLPELAGKLDGISVRVPTPDGSLVDLVVELARRTTAEEVNAALKAAADEHMGYTEVPLVSTDYIGDTHGGVVDGLCTSVLGGTQAKVLIWYDNEAGFTNQLNRLAAMVAKSM